MTELARQQPATVSSITDGSWTRAQVELVKRTVVHGVGEATDDELALFEYVCHHTGLNPFLGQIWAIRRKEQIDNAWQERMTIQVGIAGYRLIAERTSRYEGMLGPLWCGTDGQWRDVWLDAKPPAACKVGILKRGFREPLWAVATFAEFAQKTRSGELSRFWRSMPANQLAKCAKALAFREAFPQETSGIYSDAELPEIEVDHVTGEVTASTGRQDSAPIPALPAGPSVPTLDQVKQIRSVRAAKELVQATAEPFRSRVPAAIDALHHGDQRLVNPRDFWALADLDQWRQVLGKTVELYLHDQETSAAGGSPRPAADSMSPSAQVSTGKAHQAEGDPTTDSGHDG